MIYNNRRRLKTKPGAVRLVLSEDRLGFWSVFTTDSADTILDLVDFKTLAAAERAAKVASAANGLKITREKRPSSILPEWPEIDIAVRAVLFPHAEPCRE